MNRPVKVFDKFDSGTRVPEGNSANVFPINQDTGLLLASLSARSVAVPLRDFKHNADRRDSKAVDYLVIAILSVFVHTTVVEHLKHMPIAKEELETREKPPSKVQITFVQPKPKPVVQTEPPPPPPPPKVVPLKKPPKPKLKPKPAPKLVEPPPVNIPVPVTQTAAPVVSAPVAAPSPPPPPKVVEKVTQPSAGAGYLNNPPPEYPEIATDRGWEGKVLMKVHVLASGKPDTVNVTKSSGHEVLDDEAVRTVKQWSFVPGKRGTTPIDGWVTVPIIFNLQS